MIAEALGGSEEEFARAMTRKARALGMRNTTYRNANGLPNDDQITTARDQALLGIAIQERFPKYYRYFSLASFVYRGNAMRNHNHLLGKVEGVDGIKTGFTRDSGFNLVTSVRRGASPHRRGGAGRPLRRQPRRRMRELIEANIDDASTKPGVALVAGGKTGSRSAHDGCEAAACVRRARAGFARRRVRARGLRGDFAGLHRAAHAGQGQDRRGQARPAEERARGEAGAGAHRRTRPAAKDEALAETLAAAAPIGSTRRRCRSLRPIGRRHQSGVLGKLPAMMAAAKEAAIPSAKAEPWPPEPRSQAAKTEEHFPSAPPRHAIRGGWAIQVGAYEDEGEAKQHLSSAKSKVAQVLQKAEAYIERTVKGAKTYYRARFAGFDRDQAEAACKRLKREDVTCMALKI